MKTREEPWHALMVLTQQGDSRAYLTLLRAVRPYIRGILLRQLAQPDRADDITQEVLLAIHTARETWRPDLAFLPWLHGVIRYKLTDSLRTLYRQQTWEIADGSWAETLSAPIPNSEDEALDMERILASLSPHQRTLLTLTKVQGLTAAEAGRQVGMSPTAVKVAVHRILKHLKTVWGGNA